MKRDQEDVFAPKTQLEGGSSAILPGPTPDWTSGGVIRALEPLVLDARLEKLRAVLRDRIASVTVVLDNPHDPHNGSAILRSCDAFGVQTIHVLRQREEFLAAEKVALGSQRWVDIIEHPSPQSVIAALRKSGHQILVTHPQGTLSITDLPKLDRVALILGNERDGVCPELTEAADQTIAIPMRGFVESLNVSVSGAILVQAATAGRAGDHTPEELDGLYARWLRNSVPKADQVLDALEAS